MTSLEDAIDLIATHLPGPGVDALSLADARGAVLREEIVVGDAPAGESTPPSLPAGTRLTAAHLAALRWREIHTVQASRPFAWTVASPGGDGPELFAVEQMLASADGLTLKHTPFSSHPDGLPTLLAEAMVDPPHLVLAGVQTAWRDTHLVPILTSLGFNPLVPEVALFPGGKLWFGHSRSEQTLLCLSGDVTAHLLVTHRVLLPALRRLLKQNEPQPEQVTLNKDVRFSHALVLLAPARLKFDYHGASSADPLPLRPGRETAALAESHGYLEFTRYRDFFQQGETLPFHRW